MSGTEHSVSQPHVHQGDELVFTLDGASKNRSGAQEFILHKYQALAIPPGTDHTTTVTTRLWKGLSFYCDDCPLLNHHPVRIGTGIVIKSLDFRKDPSRHFRRQSLFSPELKESAFMELNFLSSNSALPAMSLTHAGETVYYVISGTISISWKEHHKRLPAQMAAAIPAGFSHQLKAEDTEGCRVIAASCSSCQILQRQSS